jgi:hypothetical protein
LHTMSLLPASPHSYHRCILGAGHSVSCDSVLEAGLVAGYVGFNGPHKGYFRMEWLTLGLTGVTGCARALAATQLSPALSSSSVLETEL